MNEAADCIPGRTRRGSGSGTEPFAVEPLTGRRFGAVLFDLDGTLIDSIAVVLRSWERWAEEEGVTEEYRRGHHHGVPAASLVASLLPPPRRAEGLRRIIDIEENDLDGVIPLPGAERALEALDGRAAIVTSCTRSLARARIAAAGLPTPALLITADDVQRGKPDPQPYLTAADRMGLPSRACLAVEDAPQGLRSALEAGCATLAVTTTHPADQLNALGATATVSSLDQASWQRGPDGIRLSFTA